MGKIMMAVSILLLAAANFMLTLMIKALRERVEKLEALEANRQIKERYERRSRRWQRSE